MGSGCVDPMPHFSQCSLSFYLDPLPAIRHNPLVKAQGAFKLTLRYSSEVPCPQGEASGRCKYDHRVGFPPRLPAFKGRPSRAELTGHLPVNAFKPADMATEIELAKLLLYKSCWLSEQHRPFSMESAMAKMFCWTPSPLWFHKCPKISCQLRRFLLYILLIMDTGLAKRVLEGDIRAASRLMREIEDRTSGGLEALKELYPKTGKAYVIGVTGAPGSGKSTLIDKMVDIFRKEGKTVGIVAVDPSSPFTGGALLGDRIRMQRHATDEGVFIRSLATRGSLGGLSRATQDIVHVMDAMGKDLILVETIGVGQDEIDIVHTAHTSIVVMVPGMGDDIQAIKAGIIEIGDLFVINKCEREGADKMERDLRMVLEMNKKREDGWEPLIFKTEAILGKGIVELAFGIYRHKQALEQNNTFEKKLRERTETIFREILKNKVLDHIAEKIQTSGEWETMIDDLMNRRADPYSLAEKIMSRTLSKH